jgi:hypothetical protein
MKGIEIVRMISLTLTLMTVFVLSWLPRRIFLMWFYFDPSPYTMLWHVVKLVGFCLMYANSAFNPMLFFILDPGIRHFFMSCCRASRKQEYVPVNSENRKDQHTIILTELTHIQPIDIIILFLICLSNTFCEFIIM